MRALRALAGIAAITLSAGVANAQDSGTHRVRVGLGAQVQPEYPGADKSTLGPLVDVSIAKGDEEFEFGAPDDSFDIDLIDSGGFTAGPALALTGKRKESDVGAPVGTVGRTIEVGAFAQAFLADHFRLRGEVRQGLGGHEGLVGNIGADAVLRDGDRYQFSIGPRLLFSSAKYQRAYFGVSEAVADLTDLPEYDPDGGIHGYGVTSGFHYAIGGRWGIFGYGRYERLVGDARRSPIVREFGSPNQLSGGLGISHVFNLTL